MSDSEADDDPMLRSMRSVWVSMRDEEPPAGGLDALMAAARAKAEELQPREPWWRRVLAALTRPPVLAMAGLVLVIGGAVVIQRRGDALDATARHEAERGAEVAPATSALSKDSEEVPAAGPTHAGSGAAGASETDPRDDHAEEKADEGRPRTQPVPPRRRVRATPPGSQVAAEDPVERGAAAGLDGASVADAAPLELTQEVKTAPPPESVAETTGVTIAGTTHAPRVVQAPADQLIAQARTAAERGDCAAAHVTAARVQKQDPIAYRDRLVKIPAVARCLK